MIENFEHGLNICCPLFKHQLRELQGSRAALKSAYQDPEAGWCAFLLACNCKLVTQTTIQGPNPDLKGKNGTYW